MLNYYCASCGSDQLIHSKSKKVKEPANRDQGKKKDVRKDQANYPSTSSDKFDVDFEQKSVSAASEDVRQMYLLGCAWCWAFCEDVESRYDPDVLKDCVCSWRRMMVASPASFPPGKMITTQEIIDAADYLYSQIHPSRVDSLENSSDELQNQDVREDNEGFILEDD